MLVGLHVDAMVLVFTTICGVSDRLIFEKESGCMFCVIRINNFYHA